MSIETKLIIEKHNRIAILSFEEVAMARKNKPSWETEQGIFPSRLRKLMDEKGVTQRRLAEVIGMRPQTVSLYVTGQSVPDINCLCKIAEFFKVSADYLIGLTDSPTPDSNLRDAARYTGLSPEAIEAVRDLNDFNITGAKVEYSRSRAALSEILEHEDLWLLMTHVVDAVKLSKYTSQGDDKTPGELGEAIETCRDMGLAVLEAGAAREYYIQRAANIFLEIVRDVKIPEKDYQTKGRAVDVRGDNDGNSLSGNGR